MASSARASLDRNLGYEIDFSSQITVCLLNKKYTLAESFSSFCFCSSNSIERGSERRASIAEGGEIITVKGNFSSVFSFFHDELCSTFGR